MTGSTKLRMLELLEREKDAFVPGQKIAEKLGTTSGAVWKTAFFCRYRQGSGGPPAQ